MSNIHFTAEEIAFVNSIMEKITKVVPEEIDKKYSKYFDKKSELYSLSNLGMVYNEVGKEIYDLLADKYGSPRSM